MSLITHAQIFDRLDWLKSKNGYRVLFAIESGSRAWGFHSPNSDYDVRFVYARPVSWYLSIQDRRDVSEWVSEDKILDYSGWDVRKALFQIHKGNPAFMEWLVSPISYFGNDRREKFKKLAGKYWNPRKAIYHYLHMAEGNYRTYLKEETVRLKKYLYVLRPLLACMWVEKHHAQTPIEWHVLLDDANLGRHIRAEMTALVARKQRGDELAEGPRIGLLNEWIEAQINHFAKVSKTTPKVTMAPDDLNELFFNIVMEEV